MAEEIRIVQPKEYYKRFLEKDVRPDNRELGEFRPVVLNIGGRVGHGLKNTCSCREVLSSFSGDRYDYLHGCVTTAEGSALIKIGNTTVICGVKAELAKPDADQPNDGFIVPNVELPSLCSPNFRPGPPGEQAQVLSQTMADVIADSRCLLVESLCICPGKLVWVLHIDLVCLDYDGNVLDACVVALVSALRNTVLPKVTVDEETGDIQTDPTICSPLQISCCPVATTFIVFDNKLLLVDPTREEESMATGAVTIVTEGDNLCSVYKPGGTPLTENQIDNCIERAFTHGREICRLIEDTLLSVDR